MLGGKVKTAHKGSPKPSQPSHAPNQGRDFHHNWEKPILSRFLLHALGLTSVLDKAVEHKGSLWFQTAASRSVLSSFSPTSHQGQSCQHTSREDAACTYFRSSFPTNATGLTQIAQGHFHSCAQLQDQDRKLFHTISQRQKKSN